MHVIRYGKRAEMQLWMEGCIQGASDADALGSELLLTGAGGLQGEVRWVGVNSTCICLL